MAPRGHFSYRFVRWRALPGPSAGNVSHRYLTSARHVGIFQRYLTAIKKVRSPIDRAPILFYGRKKWHVCFLGLLFRCCKVKRYSCMFFLKKSGSDFFMAVKKFRSPISRAPFFYGHIQWRVCFLGFLFSFCEVKRYSFMIFSKKSGSYFLWP